MNLNAYDAVEIKCTMGSWINPTYKRLYSKDIEYHPYCIFLKRYNNKLKIVDYFIAMVDEPSLTAESHGVVRDKDNVIKIDLSPIWNITSLRNIKERTLISLELKEKSNDGVVYYLDI